MALEQRAAPRLEVDGLTRNFDGRQVVKGVSFSVAAGDVACLLGPSGCGKSTILRMIAGVDRPDGGEVRVDGAELCSPAHHAPPEDRGIGLMFQDFALFPHLSVSDNVAFGLKGTRAEKRARAEGLLSSMNLSHHVDAFPHELSGGEQQRVALARAMAPSPRVLLMDEPFSGLDDRLRDAIRDETLAVLKDSETAVLLVTHEPAEAMRMADSILLMRAGEIVQEGAPFNIYNHPSDREAAAFFGDINALPAKVNHALTETPFGQFLAPGLTDGTEVDIVFRPQHVRIDFDRKSEPPRPTEQDGVPARARVLRARFIGRESLVEFKMDHDGSEVTATVPSVFLPEPGTPFWLSVPRRRCYVFPRKAA